MKHLILILSSFVLTNLSFAQDSKFPAGIIYNSFDAYKITAPTGWTLDNKAGLSNGLHCVLYLSNSTWENSPVIMYAQITSEKGITIKSFVDYATQDYLNEDKNFKHNLVRKLKTENQFDTEVYDNFVASNKSYERVAYIQLQGTICYIVFSTADKSAFKQHADKIYEVLKSFKHTPEYKGGNTK